MADLGEVALRLLDPRWDTVTATVRQWHDSTPRPGRQVDRARGSGIASVARLGGPGARQGPGEAESFVRIWRQGRIRERFEHATTPAGPALFSVYDDGEARVLVHADGSGHRVGQASNVSVAHPVTWTGDPDLLLGVLNVEFVGEATWMGRPVAEAVTTPAISAREMLGRYGPMLSGFVIGTTGALVVDRATGLVVRYEAHADDGEAVFIAEFLDLVVDAELPSDHFTYVPPPGRTIRGSFQDILDHYAAQGVDVSDLDPDDPESQRLAAERHQAGDDGAVPSGPMPPSVPPRPMSELVVPLGPGPVDPDAARAAIQEALSVLAADDGPRADGVERGELLDAEISEGRGPVRHPMRGDQTVRFELLDAGFVRDDEAVIEFRISLSGGGAFPVKGRAVRTDGRWLLSYETWAGLQQMGGYRVPSVDGSG